MAFLQRKGRLQAKESEKHEKLNMRRELAIEKYFKKKTYTVRKTKEQVSMKINRAAERRLCIQAKENKRNEHMYEARNKP